ncbi:MAG TPA: iron ABC transporter [Lentisphaeria bacterium]|nr:iron ABC transporter [Lentisphaeria bacterium]
MWDFLSQILQSLQLHHYNTRVVVSGVTVFGATAGVIGAFMLLRKRSLTGDALSHATLPGVCLAFMLSVQLGGTGKSLPVLLSGAMISGLSGLGVMLFLRHWTRLREDSILGIVLSVFFGLGVVLQGMAVNMKQGQAAGLSSFIYGRTASMLAADAWLIVVGALVASLICALLFKELTLLCFDQDFAGAQGWPVLFLDSLLMFLVAVVTVIGLQAVGLVLVVAMLITPAAAARFWTDRLAWMVWGSALIGAASGLVGALASAMVPRLPAGAVIVLIASAMFAISLVFGAKRGLIVRLLQRRHLHTSTSSQHILRALFELREHGDEAVPLESLVQKRSWTPRAVRHALARAVRAGYVRQAGDLWCLTEAGGVQAHRVVRNHRLWEIYLVSHADVATSRVDREADRIEHVLGEVMVARLEKKLGNELDGQRMPPSPHVINGHHP